MKFTLAASTGLPFICSEIDLKQDLKAEIAGDIFYLERRKTFACSITSVFISFISQQNEKETLYLDDKG